MATPASPVSNGSPANSLPGSPSRAVRVPLRPADVAPDASPWSAARAPRDVRRAIEANAGVTWPNDTAHCRDTLLAAFDDNSGATPADAALQAWLLVRSRFRDSAEHLPLAPPITHVAHGTDARRFTPRAQALVLSWQGLMKDAVGRVLLQHRLFDAAALVAGFDGQELPQLVEFVKAPSILQIDGWVGFGRVYVNLDSTNIRSAEVRRLWLEERRLRLEERLAAEQRLAAERRLRLTAEQRLAEVAGPPQAGGAGDGADAAAASDAVSSDEDTAEADLVRRARAAYDLTIAVVVAYELSHLWMRLAANDANFHAPQSTPEGALEPGALDAPADERVQEPGGLFESFLTQQPTRVRLGGLLNWGDVEAAADHRGRPSELGLRYPADARSSLSSAGSHQGARYVHQWSYRCPGAHHRATRLLAAPRPLE